MCNSAHPDIAAGRLIRSVEPTQCLRATSIGVLAACCRLQARSGTKFELIRWSMPRPHANKDECEEHEHGDSNEG